MNNIVLVTAAVSLLTPPDPTFRVSRHLYFKSYIHTVDIHIVYMYCKYLYLLN
jgi:hypothetical protein